ncbi:MAG TPA: D-alanine--D-alanine ligase [Candidatus Alectryocaccomicrobium excrementavium]|uniref:D-alanine--D-alanine ligase n=1 Tax=Candidatus Alectryocaccomicrobium excrementavium TaxID=2840668 RepID=A0A9D1K7W6_9FIRM|nr:D-alanine--D-alanine ligase [Candidatus Alectryocaccomicrobium excrementavium]
MKTRLAVIFGSRACEHDVSIISGLQALYAANTQKYDAFPVYISREGTWFVGDALRKMEFYKKPDWSAVRPVIPAGKRGKLALVDAQEHKGLFKKSLPDEIADVVMPVLHGMNGEDGTLQGMLEMWGVPYTSSGVLGSAVGMDKIAMKQLFRGCGFPVLDWVGVDRGQWFDEREAILDRVESVLPYPVFVKPANLGSSIGISRADNRQALSDALDVAAAYDRRLLVERGLTKFQEVNCAALGYAHEVDVSETEMPTSWEAFLSFDDKYLRGKGAKGMEALARKIPAPVAPQIGARVKELTKEVFQALDCKGVVRVDFLLDEESGELYVGEINTIPGSLAFYLWEPMGRTFDVLIDEMVRYAQRASQDKQQSIFSYDSSILQRGTGKA